MARETGYSNPRSASNRLAALKKNTTSGSSDKATKRKPGRQKGVSSKKVKKDAEVMNSDERQSEEGEGDQEIKEEEDQEIKEEEGEEEEGEN